MLAQHIDERGLYPIKNYSSKDYKELPQNWAIVQDNRGVMYFGNNAGVLEFDGVTWRTILIPNETTVRSLAVDKKSGKIYVGASGEIGFLAPNASGQMTYVSLLEKLKIKDKEFAEVWKTFVLDDGKVFFQTSKTIFCWDGDKMKMFKPKNGFHILFKVNNDLYVRDDNVGILKWSGNEFVLVPGTEIMSVEKIYFMLPVSKGKMLIDTRSQGLVSFEEPSKEFPMARFKPFKNNCNDLIINSLVYNAVSVSDDLISIGTLNAGVIVIDTAGNFISQFTRKEGLQQETVYHQYVDAENKLWLALANGISKVDILSPITFYSNYKGLEGSVEAIARFNNELYVATLNGVFVLRNNNSERAFEKVKGIETECWDLTLFGKVSSQKLLVATNHGLYSIDTKGVLRLEMNGLVSSVKASSFDSTIIYLGIETGFMIVKNFNEKITKIENLQSEIVNIQEEDDKHIWLGTNSEGVIELVKEDGIFNPYIHNESNGFVEGSVWAAKFHGQIVLATDKGLYAVKRNNRKIDFELFRIGEFTTGKLIGVHRAFVFTNTMWLAIYSNAKKEAESVGYLVGDEKSGYNWEESAFLKMTKEITHAIFSEENGVTWIGRPDGLYRYDSRIVNNASLKYASMIRKIVVGKDSLLYAGAGLQSNNDETSFELRYKLNSVSFNFASNSFEDESKNIYSYFLEGNDQTWSNWTSETKTNYTNLYEGTYHFRVKSRNVYGKESSEAVFSFIVLPPWYRTWWAYISYIVVLALVVWGAVAWSTYSLRKIISERTAEIRAQKEELDVKNKDITDSINYAQRLQRSILPYMDDIKLKLPNSFIFYKPRDIVSGDLYWYADKGDRVYLASIDCTGHGVPGAFLSIVANSSLNEIVNDEKELMPHTVLQKLDEKITFTLKQGNQSSTTRDGMDLALCMVDLKKNILYYSGANRPLFFIRDKQIEKIKGDKFPIGGGFDTNKQFTVSEKQLEKGDAFYIFSDGYADQFGGVDGKKFMIKKFGELLLEICDRQMDQQYNVIEETLKEWQGNHESVDDVLVIGVRI